MTPITVIPDDKHPIHFHVELPRYLPSNEVHFQFSAAYWSCNSVACKDCPISDVATPFSTCQEIALAMLADHNPDFLDQHPEYFL